MLILDETESLEVRNITAIGAEISFEKASFHTRRTRNTEGHRE
jgi:hypothetical protein